MATITIMDPVTRIEGHMKVELTIDYNQVIDAHCTGTLFRGFETILVGRDPWDAPAITERICGVCPISHGMASAMALDEATGRTAPENGRLLRNLVLGANYVQSHILHFYLLALLDYIPASQIVPVAPFAPAWELDMRFDQSQHATLYDHLVQAIKARRVAHEMGAVFAGRMPHGHPYIPGGFTATPTPEQKAAFLEKGEHLYTFIQQVYIPDVEALAHLYADYHTLGKGHGNLLAYGVFDEDAAGQEKLLRRGYVHASAPNEVSETEARQITEAVTYSWYDNSTNNLNPLSGETQPVYPKGDAYSWLKAPRYEGEPYEAGPLARMWVNGDYRNGVSVMDRHLARAHETLKVLSAMGQWLNDLVPGAPVYSSSSSQNSGVGVGLTEAPRGALGHWVEIAGGRLSHYQVVTPTCWNASPRDHLGVPGPMEAALIGTPIEDPAKPIEALRVIHSFDPCLSCAVHVIRPNGTPLVVTAGPAAV